MNTPPTDKECEVILQWMHTYYDGELLHGEREFIRDNYWKDDFEGWEMWAVHDLVRDHLTPLPESLEKELRKPQ